MNTIQLIGEISINIFNYRSWRTAHSPSSLEKKEHLNIHKFKTLCPGAAGSGSSSDGKESAPCIFPKAAALYPFQEGVLKLPGLTDISELTHSC